MKFNMPTYHFNDANDKIAGKYGYNTKPGYGQRNSSYGASKSGYGRPSRGYGRSSGYGDYQERDYGRSYGYGDYEDRYYGYPSRGYNDYRSRR